MNKNLLKKKLRFRFWQFISPVRDKVIIFECFHGKRYADNVKAIYEAMLADPAYKDFLYIWAFSDVEAHEFLNKQDRTEVVKKNSKKYFRYYSTARYWVNNVSLPDFLTPNKSQTYIETWHGTPLKRLGCDITTHSDPRQSTKTMHNRYRMKGRKIDFLLSPSPYYTEKMTSAFDMTKYHHEDRVIETGYPRNDALFHYSDEEIVQIKKRLQLPLDKKLVLYTPTWRDTNYSSGKGFQYTEAIDFKKLMKELGPDVIVLFRAHHQVGLSDVIGSNESVVDVTSVDDVNDLYIISDLMITDYSSTMYDYANLKRPMVYYMYDLEQYANEIRGFYMDINDLPGPIVQDSNSLAKAIRQQLDHFTYDEKYKAFNERFNPLDDGQAAKRVLAECISLEPHKLTFREHLINAAKATRKGLRQFYSLSKYNLVGVLRKLGLCHNSNSRKLQKMKNSYKGKRCFLIGNGPSLTANDLDALKGEITFGTNMIYKIYDQTNWRPTFHCVSDSIYATKLGDELYANVAPDSTLLTIEKTYYRMEKRPKNTVYVASLAGEHYKIRGNVYAYCKVKATVLSLAVEYAFHMGFSEIYLLGVDCTNPHAAGGHFTDQYSSKEVTAADMRRIKSRMKVENTSTEKIGEHIIDRSMDVYKTIGDYAKMHGIKMYNATRGGNLELFPRVNLDDVLK